MKMKLKDEQFVVEIFKTMGTRFDKNALSHQIIAQKLIAIKTNLKHRKKRIKVSPEEHSRLLYLLDALNSAPNKYEDLLNLALESVQPSQGYLNVIRRLRRAGRKGALFVASTKLRSQLL